MYFAKRVNQRKKNYAKKSKYSNNNPYYNRIVEINRKENIIESYLIVCNL